jgi:cytidine deaminase
VAADADGNILRQTTVRDLLPEAFGPSQLK